MHIYEGADITLYLRCGMNNQKIGHLSSQPGALLVGPQLTRLLK